jgi:F420-dependent oxidoreductase-like protein
MEICLMIEGQEGVTWEQWLNLARACEEHGLDGLFRSDHYLSFDHPEERGTLDAWTTLAALAAVTDRIRLGTLVSPVGFRHPSQLAKAVVTADHVSNGRIELGMGAGWFEPEHRAFGFAYPSDAERMDILAEQLEIVHRSWDRDFDDFDFRGAHYRLERCIALPKPVQEPHPPLIMGGGARTRSAALAARWADEYNVHAVDPASARQMRARIASACEAIDRDPAEVRFSLMTTLLVGVDASDVRRRARVLMDRTDERGDVEAFLDGIRGTRLVGTAEQIVERLGELGDAGVDRVFLQHLVHDDLETVELIGRAVVPEAASR